MFQRRPSALAPLDGARAIASLWVISFHALEFGVGVLAEYCQDLTPLFW